MAHFWMDISRDDDGEVMSVVAGCKACGLRTVTNDISEARSWIAIDTQKNHHFSETRAIDQVGDRLKLVAGRKPYVPVVRGQRAAQATPATDHLIGLFHEHGSLTTHEAADLLGRKYNSAFVTLKRAHQKGLLTKTKQGSKVLWEALEAGIATPEAELATVTTLELIKPSERLLRPFYGNPKVLQGFSDNAAVYGRFGFKGHMGLDIGIVMQPVLAAHDGIVEYAGDGGEWPIMGAAAGECILLKGDGFRTGYAHLSRQYVGIGDVVKAGDVIGISGDTGATTGFHLHFELLLSPLDMLNGYAGRTDPTPYLAGAA